VSRKRRASSNDDTEARKKRVRSFRSSERRQQRKQKSDDPQDLTWLNRVGIRVAAMKVLNEQFHDVPPFWLSIPWDYPKKVVRNHPQAQYYPCRSHRVDDRLWFGFMFREHRDAQCLLWPDAVKELTPESD